MFCGDLATAAATVSETESVEEATGIRSAPYGALILSAWQGREIETTNLIEATEREANARGEGIGLAISAYARAVLCNGLGRYEEALAAAVTASEHREVVAENWGLSELIEPATRTGRTDLAAEALKRLARKAHATGTDWALGIDARSRALLSEDDRAEGYFLKAIDHLSRTRVRAELARTHLLYGEWLRRMNRRVDARAQLRIAYDSFTSMGMEAFAERAGRELLGDGRDRPQADRRDTRRSDPAGAADRRAGPRWSLEPRDRRAALPQPAHRGVAPAPRVRQARDSIPSEVVERAGTLIACRRPLRWYNAFAPAR